MANVRVGSIPEEREHHPGGPHLRVKQTKSGAKQTLPLEGLLSGKCRLEGLIRLFPTEPGTFSRLKVYALPSVEA